MITYKLFRIKDNKLYPLYVLADKPTPIGVRLKAEVGELADETHVKAKGCGGRLALRSGFHSALIPYTDWIGKKASDGSLIQRKDTVWCECEVEGKEIESKTRNGYRIIPKNSWYYFKTNTHQKYPWIISEHIIVNKILTQQEVSNICNQYKIQPQKVEEK